MLKPQAFDSYKIIYTRKSFWITAAAHLWNLPRAPAKWIGTGACEMCLRSRRQVPKQALKSSSIGARLAPIAKISDLS